MNKYIVIPALALAAFASMVVSGLMFGAATVQPAHATAAKPVARGGEPVPAGMADALQKEYADFLTCAIPKNKDLFKDNNLSELTFELNSAGYANQMSNYTDFKTNAALFHTELARQKALVGC